MKRKSTVSLAGTAVACPCHACAFYNDIDEEYDILLPFVKEGYDAGERAVHILDKNHRSERLRRLKLGGVDVEAALANGQLEVEIWDDVYLRGGEFNYTDMLTFVQENLDAGRLRGFARTRVWGNMEWALFALPGVKDLAEYECRLNYILPLYDDAVVCAYNVSQFSAPVLEDIVRAHPYLIADGWVQKNPHYLPPDDFLKQLGRGQS
jgi:hypothetical protein